MSHDDVKFVSCTYHEEVGGHEGLALAPLLEVPDLLQQLPPLLLLLPQRALQLEQLLHLVWQQRCRQKGTNNEYPGNLSSSVPDPWHFAVDPDPDPRIHASN